MGESLIHRLRRLGLKRGLSFGLSEIPEDRIRQLAKRLAKQRPWRSDEENWLDAEKAVGAAPIGPWIIQFSGEKERSGWDWTELIFEGIGAVHSSCDRRQF